MSVRATALPDAHRRNDGMAGFLPIGHTDDALEREADAMASAKTSRTRACPVCLQRAVALAGLSAGGDAPPSVAQSLRSAGESLPDGVRGEMEQHFHWDFSKVRVHHDSNAERSAREVGALAYTVGEHIVFRPDQFAPETEAGRHLIAHELAHVTQQAIGGARLQRQPAPTPVCRQTNRWPGNIEHSLIEDDYLVNINPLAGAVEYLIPNSGPNGGTGYADLVDTAQNKIYEIKTFVGTPQGVIEAERYAVQAQLNCPPPIPRIWSVGNDYPAHTIPISNDEELVVQQYPQFPGVVVYYRRRRRRVSEPVPVSVPYGVPEAETEDERRRRDQPQPVPIPVPVPVRQMIVDFIRRTVQAGIDADRAVGDFLQQHPELAYAIAAAGAALFIATIAEDIATFGAGLLDDPATMALAWALFRGALRYAR
jgi:hypothetical protein